MDEQCPDTTLRIRVALRQRLNSLLAAGVQQLRRSPTPAPEDPLRGSAAGEPPVVDGRGAVRPHSPSSAEKPQELGGEYTSEGVQADLGQCAEGDQQSQLHSLRQQVVGCTLCTDLAQNRTQTVFGVGAPQTRLCFLGEAPGADEDRLGQPFVGKAGQLLDRIIAACTLRREEVYILNVLKCRPPGNRTPLPDEVANCRGYFERQLEIIRPEFICCLGAVAAQSLLRTTQSLGRLRGRFHDYRDSRVLVTYHPAYLLRYPNMKRAAWEDMKMLMREMGIEIPTGRS